MSGSTAADDDTTSSGGSPRSQSPTPATTTVLLLRSPSRPTTSSHSNPQGNEPGTQHVNRPATALLPAGARAPGHVSQLAPNPNTPMATGGPAMNPSVTLPPRPRPGRKPATDDPPTKRKAQNREAQRAFRARRAAKVEDYETQIKTLTEKSRQDTEDAEARYNALANEGTEERERFRRELADMRNENRQMRNQLEAINRLYDAMMEENEQLRRGQVPDLTAHSSWMTPAEQVGLHLHHEATLKSKFPFSERFSFAERGRDGFIPPATAQGPGQPPMLPMHPQAAPLTPPMMQPGTEGFDPFTDIPPDRRLPPPEPTTRSSQSEDVFLRQNSRTMDTPMPDAYPAFSSNYESQETDFTNFGKRSSRPGMTSMQQSLEHITSPTENAPAEDSPAEGPTIAEHESCGFCTDESNCMCIDQGPNGLEIAVRERALEHTTASPIRNPPAVHIPGQEYCGFCTDVSNCLCIRMNQKNQGRSDGGAVPGSATAEPAPTDPQSMNSAPTQPAPMGPTSESCTINETTPTSTIAPGTCDQCRQNPELKRACETFASRHESVTLAPTPSFTAPDYGNLVDLNRNFSVSQATAGESLAATSGPLMATSADSVPFYQASIGCAEAFMRLSQANIDINDDWVQQTLSMAPPDRRGTGLARRPTAFDIEGASILATLGVARRHTTSNSSHSSQSPHGAPTGNP